MLSRVLMGYALLYGMFLLMSFALARGYRAAVVGSRLAVIPVALASSHRSRRTSERWGAARVMAWGWRSASLPC